MNVEELQHIVSLLPAEELDRFSKWFEEFLADQWDRRIEADIPAGRLDAVGRRADKDFEAGRCAHCREPLRDPRVLVPLPVDLRELADRCFAMLLADPRHPSLRFKTVAEFWSARIGLRVRALARERPEGFVWFWIGPHNRYEQLIAQ